MDKIAHDGPGLQMSESERISDLAVRVGDCKCPTGTNF